MKQLSENTIIKLKQVEKYLKTAHLANYVMAMPVANAKIVAESYAEMGYSVKNINCHRCVYEMTKAVAEQYYIQIEKVTPDETKIETNINCQEEQKNSPDETKTAPVKKQKKTTTKTKSKK